MQHFIWDCFLYDRQEGGCILQSFLQRSAQCSARGKERISFLLIHRGHISYENFPQLPALHLVAVELSVVPGCISISWKCIYKTNTWAHLRLNELETLGVGPSNLCVNLALRGV